MSVCVFICQRQSGVVYRPRHSHTLISILYLLRMFSAKIAIENRVVYLHYIQERDILSIVVHCELQRAIHIAIVCVYTFIKHYVRVGKIFVYIRVLLFILLTETLASRIVRHCGGVSDLAWATQHKCGAIFRMRWCCNWELRISMTQCTNKIE